VVMKNKVIWVVGATSGLGLEVAKQLSKHNQVIVSGRNEKVLAQMGLMENIYPIPLDSTNDEQIATAVSTIETRFERLDVVIYSAGLCHYIDIENFDLQLVRDVYEVNVFGSINVIKHALPLLKKNPNRPLIAPVASLSTLVPFSRAQAYASSKSAMTYWFESLRVDCHAWLDVTIINPGFIKTPMIAQNDFPMPGLMEADVAAKKLVKGLEKRPLTLQFPKRLAWPLNFFAFFKTLWCKVIAPKTVR